MLRRDGSPLSLWCNRLIELGWLVALMIVPIYIDVFTSRVFEPSKSAMLRSLALLMSALWLVKWVDQRGQPPAPGRLTWRTPLIAPMLLLIVTLMVSTFASLSPRVSLLGSYQRMQGVYAALSCMVIFVMMVQGMRTRAQLDRAFNVIVLASLPVALYGLLQRLGGDPLPWGGPTVVRVSSTLGNAIFLAGYLLFASMLTLGRMIEMGWRMFQPGRARAIEAGLLIGCSGVAVAQLYALFELSGSLGPQMAWAFGAAFWGLLLLREIRDRGLRARLTLAAGAFWAVAIALVVLLNVSDSPVLIPLKDLPVLDRLSVVLNFEGGTNRVRELIWAGTADLMAPHAPLGFPDGSVDTLNALRPLVGYGTETMYGAYNWFYRPEIGLIEARNASPDHAKNMLWDAFVSSGLLGVGATLALVAAAFLHGFRWLGVLRTPRDAQRYWGCVLAGAAAGALVSLIWLAKPAFLAVGVGLGFAAGMVLTVIASALRHDATSSAPRLPTGDRVMLSACLATLFGHLIETQTASVIVTTRLYFWAVCALMVVIGLRRAGETSAPAPGEGVGPAQPGIATGVPLLHGALLGLLVGLVNMVTMSNFEQSNIPGRVILNRLSYFMPYGMRFNGMGALCGVTFASGVLILGLDAARAQRVRTRAAVAATFALMSGVAVFVYLLGVTLFARQHVAALSGVTGEGLERIMQVAEALSMMPVWVHLYVFWVMCGAAWLWQRADGQRYNPPPQLNLRVDEEE